MNCTKTTVYKGLLLGTLLTATLIADTGVAQASLYSWSGSPTVTGSRDISNPSPGQKITAAWHAYDSGYHYFRIDLASAPQSFDFTNPDGSPDFAGIYGIYIDSKNGGLTQSSAANKFYAPHPGAGSVLEANYDYILDSHYQPFMTEAGWGQSDFHAWDGTTLVMLANGMNAEQNGATLEWKVAANSLGNPASFSWTAASIDSGALVTTYSMTQPAVATPIPAAAWLFGSGLLGLVGIRRRS